MVRMGIIGALDAFLVNMCRGDSVRVAIAGGRNNPSPVHVVHARTGPYFIRHGRG